MTPVPPDQTSDAAPIAPRASGGTGSGDVAATRVDPTRETDWAPSWALLREHARTFSFGSRFLAADRRNAIAATYAWCRIADDIVDTAGEVAPSDVAAALDRWEHELVEPVHPVSVAFAAARRR